MAAAWHTLERAKTLEELGVSPEQGLDAESAAERLTRYGRNEIVERGAKSPWKILAEQFMRLLVILLVVAAFVSGVVLKEWIDCGVILVIVVLNAALGFRQEFKAEEAMAALKKLTTPKVRVRRGGHASEVSSADVVPGDIVLIEAGNRVPADLRLLEAAALRVEEASLTGESVPVTKDTEAIFDENAPLGDRTNMAYRGTTVTYGRGVGVAVATGMQTELGKIADRLQTVEKEDSPLQTQLHRLGKFLVVATLILIAIIAGIGVARGQDLKTIFLTAVSMAVAAVPEGLPAAVTIALALGAQRMLSRRSLIRKLAAVETLGAVTTICSDKTGTLTQNRMTLELIALLEGPAELPSKTRGVVSLGEHPACALALVTGALCNDAELASEEGAHGDRRALGDPTEGALLIAAAEAGLVKGSLSEVFPRVAEVPFDSERKRMTTVHAVRDENGQLSPELTAARNAVRLATDDASHVAFTKGAVDSVLEASTRVWSEGTVAVLDEENRQRLLDQNATLAGEGIRVLGLAFKPLSMPPRENDTAAVEEELVFAGMAGMVDPMRPEAHDAVDRCVDAGIRPVMITGDHPRMAQYIARQLGMLPTGIDRQGQQTGVLTGRELETMSEADLEGVVEDVSIYARVAPEHKLRIVDALQAKGHICAMTGDGVNDAPALKSADIGVAMGITGTDVTKEAADMVLQDDNFATIVAAVEEGRTIYNNIRRFIRFLLACNTGELWVFLMAPFLGMPLPLLPVQILWMNLVTDGFPALGLGVEGAERDVMQRPPRDPKVEIVDLGQVAHILWVGVAIGVLSLILGFVAWRGEGAPAGIGSHGAVTAQLWQTMLFCTMVFGQLFLALAERSDRASLLTIGIGSNPYLLGAVGGSFILQLAVVYMPILQRLFKTTALSIGQLLMCLAAGAVVLMAVEVAKAVERRATR